MPQRIVLQFIFSSRTALERYAGHVEWCAGQWNVLAIDIGDFSTR